VKAQIGKLRGKLDENIKLDVTEVDTMSSEFKRLRIMSNS
jgi:hypothetical protein